jgi:hypothetical protein
LAGFWIVQVLGATAIASFLLGLNGHRPQV